MKLSIDRRALHRAASIAGNALPTRNTPKPILRNVKVSAGDAAYIEAGDLEVAARLALPDGAVSVDEPGELLIPHGALLAISGDQSIERLEVRSDGNHAELTSERSQHRVPIEDAREYPSFPVLDAKGGFEVVSHHLFDAIRRVEFATDPGSSRYALEGVLFEIDGGKLNLVAADGHRISRVQLEMQQAADECYLLVPPKALRLVMKAAEDAQLVGVSFSHGAVQFTCGDTAIWSRLIEGRFPKWQMLLGTFAAKHAIELPSGPALAAIKRASLSASEESCGMRWSFKGGALELRTRSKEFGESRATLPVSFGGEFETALNAALLVKFFQVTGADSMVTMNVSRPDGMALFRDGSHEFGAMPLSLG